MFVLLHLFCYLFICFFYYLYYLILLLQYYSLPDQFVVVSSVCYHKNKNKISKEILNMAINYLSVEKCNCELDTFPGKHNVLLSLTVTLYGSYKGTVVHILQI